MAATSEPIMQFFVSCPVTDFLVQILPSASPPPTHWEKSLELLKTIHNTMKQTKNLKRKLNESQLNVGSMIDPKIDLKHKPVNYVEHWALGTAYQIVH